VLKDVPADITYAALLDLLHDDQFQQPLRLVVAGPPSRQLEMAPTESISPVVQDGDSLFVIALQSATTALAPQAKVTPKTKSKHSIKTKTWTGFKSKSVPSRGRGRGCSIGKVSFASAGMGRVLATGDEGGTSGEPSGGAKVNDDDTGMNIGESRTRLSIEESMALAVVTAADGGGGAAGKLLRSGMQAALAERQKETEAEGRYSAWLSGKYEHKYFSFEHGDGVVVFRVRYLPHGERKWREDPLDDDEYFPTWSKKVLGKEMSVWRLRLPWLFCFMKY
jgi:hypothetical protein